MEELLEFILKGMVTEPEKVIIDKTVENSVITFNITASDDDKGIVIGKNGRNIKAIRNIVSIIARGENKTVYLKVD